MFPVKAIFLGVLVATQAYSAPDLPRVSSIAVQSKLVAMRTQSTPFGELVYYGLPPGSENTTRPISKHGGVNKRCGSNVVGCDSRNVPNADPCLALIYGGLLSNNDILPDCTHALCLSTVGQCCISWSQQCHDLRTNDLFNAAAAVYGGCVAHGASGMTSDTNLRGLCGFQCLSNRPDGCA
ncbi:hypothetical protein AURDEDRAFT_164214 [Auricularia subglabra TFB-10046 SS5]|nr:hypothetical protein AURDEDRAFT_164214 [Auricularia subglabra TFB-10046 SS5]